MEFLQGPRVGQETSYFWESPIGPITLSCDEEAITELLFGKRPSPDAIEGETELIRAAVQQLREYFASQRQVFGLPLKPTGTAFQLRDWRALLDIPYGETRSYKQIACAIGNEKACRAVGLANNRNPISIIVPCHRVVGSNGKLVGYGGGLEAKEFLLQLEKSGSRCSLST